ncbi:hypothetical protein P344_07160 [Spiroplasma mirum ATCC 29335]|uniref:Uncharacterized protein n=1 Tax=Spiroplasma mirum ATCC 29335 TaxID=838561 RepID=W0GMU8_9MOLU|nr:MULTISPECIES: hypothetical protein [Spiroplasma]AHF61570.1 hypothetical protein SMM_1203 [Spiroplasma mirum ATCC 29335]AHI58728.1 hypothetical protein P344_07160 [Spiroplasma mirum ATCC 29335]AKM53604.1 hypothetical protein SATRI_v1c12720 [Spiroplasma atrichopogonis]
MPRINNYWKLILLLMMPLISLMPNYGLNIVKDDPVKTNNDLVNNVYNKFGFAHNFIVGKVYNNLSYTYLYNLSMIPYPISKTGFYVATDQVNSEKLEINMDGFNWNKLPLNVQQNKFYYLNLWTTTINNEKQLIQFETDPLNPPSQSNMLNKTSFGYQLTFNKLFYYDISNLFLDRRIYVKGDQ